jgi:hypothetical protein
MLTIGRSKKFYPWGEGAHKEVRMREQMNVSDDTVQVAVIDW